MGKLKLKKGDKIIGRSPSIRDENEPKEIIGGHNQYEKPLTVTKVFNHGVRTLEQGYVHNNNIISKIQPHDFNRTGNKGY